MPNMVEHPLPPRRARRRPRSKVEWDLRTRDAMQAASVADAAQRAFDLSRFLKTHHHEHEGSSPAEQHRRWRRRQIAIQLSTSLNSLANRFRHIDAEYQAARASVDEVPAARQRIEAALAASTAPGWTIPPWAVQSHPAWSDYRRAALDLSAAIAALDEFERNGGGLEFVPTALIAAGPGVRWHGRYVPKGDALEAATAKRKGILAKIQSELAALAQLEAEVAALKD